MVKPLESSAAAASLRWTTRPYGTIDRLMVFGPDGRLRQAVVFGAGALPGAQGQYCLAKRGRVRMVLHFLRPPPATSQLLRVGYLASPRVNGDVALVGYGGSAQVLTVQTGLHDAYFPVNGSADSVTLFGPAVTGLCVGEVQAGVVLPSRSGLVIPAMY